VRRVAPDRSGCCTKSVRCAPRLRATPAAKRVQSSCAGKNRPPCFTHHSAAPRKSLAGRGCFACRFVPYPPSVSVLLCTQRPPPPPSCLARTLARALPPFPPIGKEGRRRGRGVVGRGSGVAAVSHADGVCCEEGHGRGPAQWCSPPSGS